MPLQHLRMAGSSLMHISSKKLKIWMAISSIEHEIEPVDVFSPETSYIVTDMLRDVLKPGGTGAQVPQNMKFHYRSCR